MSDLVDNVRMQQVELKFFHELNTKCLATVVRKHVCCVCLSIKILMSKKKTNCLVQSKTAWFFSRLYKNKPKCYFVNYSWTYIQSLARLNT